MYMDTITRFKFQDASTYQELAALCFRVAKRFQDAGVAYKSCGRAEERLKKPENAASFYHMAALCFQKDDPLEAAACYMSSINLYCQVRRFATAGRLEARVSEIMEKDRNRQSAILHWTKAADFYRAHTCHDRAADRCLLKDVGKTAFCSCELYKFLKYMGYPRRFPERGRVAAHDLAESGDHVTAAALFEQVGHRMVTHELLKFNAPDAFLRAILCLVYASGTPPKATADTKEQGRRCAAVSSPRPAHPTPTSVIRKISRLSKKCAIFQGSKACLFAADVAGAAKAGDLELFASSVYAYDNVCALDSWYLRLLKAIAGHVEAKSIVLEKIRAKQEKSRRMKSSAEESPMGNHSPGRVMEVDGDISSEEDSDRRSPREPMGQQRNDSMTSGEGLPSSSNDQSPGSISQSDLTGGSASVSTVHSESLSGSEPSWGSESSSGSGSSSGSDFSSGFKSSWGSGPRKGSASSSESLSPSGSKSSWRSASSSGSACPTASKSPSVFENLSRSESSSGSKALSASETSSGLESSPASDQAASVSSTRNHSKRNKRD